jgi:hypothetical protein
MLVTHFAMGGGGEVGFRWRLGAYIIFHFLSYLFQIFLMIRWSNRDSNRIMLVCAHGACICRGTNVGALEKETELGDYKRSKSANGFHNHHPI